MSYTKPTKKLLLLSLVLISSIFVCCKKDEDSDDDLIGDWVERSNFEGNARNSAVGFSIGDKAYVGTGYDGTKRYQDFWEFDPEFNFWQQKADLPGVARSEAVGFATVSNGYIGTGYDGSNALKDFYEYDPISDTWLQKCDFKGTARYGAVAFELYEKGYIGTGYDGNYKKDFWEYDPLLDTFIVIPSLGGNKRMDAVAMAINEKGYVLSGINNGLYVNDVWEYNPTTKVWNQKNDLAYDSDDDGSYNYDYRSYAAASFVINNKGYICGGYSNGYKVTTAEYNPSDDSWTQRVDMECSARMDAVGININNRGFILTGKNGNSRYDDFWEFIK